MKFKLGMLICFYAVQVSTVVLTDEEMQSIVTKCPLGANLLKENYKLHIKSYLDNRKQWISKSDLIEKIKALEYRFADKHSLENMMKLDQYIIVDESEKKDMQKNKGLGIILDDMIKSNLDKTMNLFENNSEEFIKEKKKKQIYNPKQIKKMIHEILSKLIDRENPDEALQNEVNKYLIMNFDNISLSVIDQLYAILLMYNLTDFAQIIIHNSRDIIERNIAQDRSISESEVLSFGSFGLCLDYMTKNHSSGYLIMQYILNKDRSRISLAFILHPIKTVVLILTLMLIIILSCLLYRYLPLCAVIMIGFIALCLLFIGILWFSTYETNAGKKKLEKDCRNYIITLLKSELKDSSGYLDNKKTMPYSLKLDRDNNVAVLTLTRNDTPETYNIKLYDNELDSYFIFF